MRIMNLISEQPSSSPASYSSSGILVWKNVRATTMLYTLTAPGSHSAKYELYRPHCLTMRKVGIRPPLNSIVKANRPVMIPRP